MAFSSQTLTLLEEIFGERDQVCWGQIGGMNSQMPERGAEIYNQKTEYLVQG